MRPFPAFASRFPSAALCLAAATVAPACSAEGPGGEAALTERLHAHAAFLADDRLEGRETGTPGAREAEAYIEAAFREIGLAPGTPEGYIQAFAFTAGKAPSADSRLVLGGTELVPDEDWYALAEGGEGRGAGTMAFGGYAVATGPDDDGVPALPATGIPVLLDWSVPGGFHPHSAYYDQVDLRLRIERAVAAGASALVLTTLDPHVDPPAKHWRRTVAEAEIPVFWLTPAGYRKAFGEGEPRDLSLEWALAWERDEREGHNVLALLDHPGTDRLVVVGAHYDHLGWGISGSLHNGEPAVHNGADDNASGVAALIEIARALKREGPEANDLLFVAFSGEELGLYGSKHFVRGPGFDTARVNYMVNLDMVGRLDSADRQLIVDGAASSPAFAALDDIHRDSVRIRAGGSGIGSSDHMSFYLEGVPSLHFFTGTHGDYHRPSDDIEKLNVAGMATVVGCVTDLIAALDDDGKLAYVRVAEEQEAVPDFQVTLGVIPDYLFEGRGMRIESVREGRPAANAGLADGDVVLGLGDVEVLDMMSYMKALGRFRKGQTVDVTVERGGETLTMPLTF
jgi:aminopeptidase YwaD